jgi:hypothetical protein
LRIRRELGGDPYRGTIFQRFEPSAGAPGDEGGPSGDSPRSGPEEEFAAALRTAAATAESQPYIDDRMPVGPLWRTEDVVGTDLVGDLRRAARGLDAQAADFEDMELSAEADRLWKLAKKLRATARQLRGGMTPPIRR